MFRRPITNEERKRLIDLGLSQHVLASSVSLLRTTEVEDIIEGNDEKWVRLNTNTSNIPITTEKPTDTKRSPFTHPTRRCLARANRKNRCSGCRRCPTRAIWTLYRKRLRSTGTVLPPRKYARSRCATTTPIRKWTWTTPIRARFSCRYG